MGVGQVVKLKRILAAATSVAMTMSTLLPASAFSHVGDDLHLSLNAETNWDGNGYSFTHNQSIFNYGDSYQDFIDTYGEFTVTVDITDISSSCEIDPTKLYAAFFIMGNDSWNWQTTSGTFDENGHAEFKVNAGELVDRSFGENDTAIGSAGIQVSYTDDAVGPDDTLSCNFDYSLEYGDPDSRDITLEVVNNPWGEGYSANYQKNLMGSGYSFSNFTDRFGDYEITADISDLITDSDISPEDIQICFFVMGNRDWKWAADYASFDADGHAVIKGNAYDLLERSITPNDYNIGNAGLELSLISPDKYQLGDSVSFNWDWKGKYTEAKDPNIVTSGDYTYYKNRYSEWEYDEETGDEKKVFKYNAEIMAYSGKGGDIAVPSELDGISVNVIRDSAFQGNNNITGVTIPESITQISYSAFADCAKLSSVTLPNTDLSIESSAFYNCPSLKEVTIPRLNRLWNDYQFGYVKTERYDDYWGETVTEPAPIEGFKIYCYHGTSGYDYARENNFDYEVLDLKQSGEYEYVLVDTSYWEYDEEKGTDVLVERHDARITGYSGKGGNMAIPAEIDGYTVTEIGNEAFANNNDITGVTFPKSITRIGNSAFKDCGKLASVTLPEDSGAQIEYRAFFNCPGLKEITVPRSVDIYNYGEAFGYTAEIDEWGGQNTAKISDFKINCYFESSAYYYAKENDFDYKVIDLKKSGDYSYVPQTYGEWVYDEYGEEKYVETNVARIVGYTGKGGNITLPAQLDGLEVVTVPQEVFSNNADITGVTFPETVRFINENAFRNCANLASVKFLCGTDKTLEIQSCAFYDCPKLKEVTIPKKATVSNAFGYVDKTVEEEGYSYTYSEKLDDFKIYCYYMTEGHDYAKENGFEYEVIDIKETDGFAYVVEQETSWVYDEETDREKRVTSDYANIIGYTGAGGKVSIPEKLDGYTVRYIGYEAFMDNADITGVVIPETVGYVRSSAFNGCEKLSSVVFDDDCVTSVEPYAFANCPSLKEVTLPRNIMLDNEGYAFGYQGSFDDCEKINGFKINCYYKTSAHEYAKENGFDFNVLDLYKSGDFGYILKENDNWDDDDDSDKSYAVIVEYYGNGGAVTIPAALDDYNVRIVAAETFKGSEKLTSAAFTDTLKEIEYEAFANCPKLSSVTLPDNDLNIGDRAFFNCPALKEVTINKHNWLDKNWYAFGYVSSGKEDDEVKLDGFKIKCYFDSDGLEYADYNGFDYEIIGAKQCGDYTYIVEESTTWEFDSYGVEKLVTESYAKIIDYTGKGGNITIPAELDGYRTEKIGNKAFMGDPDITGVTFPDTIDEIGISAFKNCPKLASVTLPDNGADIYDEAFFDCPSLKQVTINRNNWVSAYYDAFGYLPNNDGDGEWSSEYKKVDGFKILCYFGTAGHKYALKNKFDCEVLDLKQSGDYLYVLDENDSAKIVGYTGKGGKLTLPTELDGVKVTAIGSEAFANNADITGVTVPDSIYNIESSAFAGCKNLSSVALPEDSTYSLYIGSEAFFNCPSLKEITIPKYADIWNGECAFGYLPREDGDDWEDYSYRKVEGFKIYCYYGTNGHSYAKENGFDHEVLDLKKSGDYEYILDETTDWEYDPETGDDKPVTSYEANIVSYTGKGGSIAIPAELDGYKVHSIGVRAFENNTSVTAVTVPETVRTIDYGAFMGCSKLSSITLPERTYISIEDKAFFDCPSLKEVTLDRDKSIYKYDHTFGFKSTGSEDDSSDTYEKTEGFTLFCYAGSSAHEYALYTGVNFVLLDAEVSGDYIYSVNENTGYAAIIGYTGSGKALAIPAELDGHPVNNIGSSAFEGNTTVESVTLPAGVGVIGSSAFEGCASLKEVNLPKEGSMIINDRAFYDCPKLDRISFNSGYSSIDSLAIGFVETEKDGYLYNENVPGFTVCCYYNTGAYRYAKANGLEIVLLDENVDGDFVYEVNDGKVSITGYIGNDKEVTVPAKIKGMPVTELCSSTFEGNSTIEAVKLPNGLESIDSDAFSECYKLKSIEVPDSVTYIGPDAFEYCTALTSAKLGTGIKEINNRTFFRCTALESVNIPDGVTSIGDKAFYGCGALKELTVPRSVKNIGDGALGKYTNYNTDEVDTVDSFKISGYRGSAAEKYAKANNIEFEALDTGVLLGDVNGDGSIGMKDITELQRYVNGWNNPIVEAAADVDQDGSIGMKDITTLQRMVNAM